MKEIKTYQCSFCTFYRKTKHIVKNHEDNCYHNPKNKACATCQHNIIDYETVYNPYHGGDPGSTDFDVRYNWCEKYEMELNKETLRMNCDKWNLK